MWCRRSLDGKKNVIQKKNGILVTAYVNINHQDNMYAKKIICGILAYAHISAKENVKLISKILIKNVVDNLVITCEDEILNKTITSVPKKKHIFSILLYQ